MTIELHCPVCAHDLKPLPVSTPEGEPLDAVHGCSHCMKAWAADGCLQKAWSDKARHQLVGGMTSHTCVQCRILLTPAVLPADTAVEVCSACHGLLLDQATLVALGAARPRPSPAPVSRLPSVPPPPPRMTPGLPEEWDEEATPPPNTFECVLCAQHKPLREGQALLDGLACRACMQERARG